MDTFCILFKSFGDYLLYGIGLWIAACALSPTFKAWFKQQENAMKKTRWKSILFGVSLAVFCTALIAASVRIQLIQLKEQSPGYQSQMILKFHTKNLAAEFAKYADDYDKLAASNNGQVWNKGLEFRRQFDDKTRLIQTRLDEEGRDTQKLYELYYKAAMTSRGNDRNPLSDEVREISKELTNLANQLPTHEQNH